MWEIDCFIANKLLLSDDIFLRSNVDPTRARHLEQNHDTKYIKKIFIKKIIDKYLYQRLSRNPVVHLW